VRMARPAMNELRVALLSLSVVALACSSSSRGLPASMLGVDGGSGDVAMGADGEISRADSAVTAGADGRTGGGGDVASGTDAESVDVATDAESVDVATDAESVDVATDAGSVDVAVRGGSDVQPGTDGPSGDVGAGTDGDAGTGPDSMLSGDGSGHPDVAPAVGDDGGAPATCNDPNFPVACPPRGNVPATCWTAGTMCTSITRCGDQLRSCSTAGAYYDCTAMTCLLSSPDGGVECGDPLYPVSCPAKGDVPSLCWTAGTICSTLRRCGNDFRSCLTPGYHFSCEDQRCVPDQDGGSGDAG